MSPLSILDEVRAQEEPAEAATPPAEAATPPGEAAELERLGLRQAALEPAWGFECGVRPEEDGWLRPSEVDKDAADAWLTAQDRQLGAGRMVAAAYLGWGLEYRLVNAVTVALLAGPVLPLPSPEHTLLLVDERGEATAVCFCPRPGRPAAPGTGAERALAGALVETMTPIVAAVRTASGFPLAGLWGMVADSVAGTAATLGRRVGGDSFERFWARSEQVLDEMAAAGAYFRRRPFLADPPAPDARFVRGTCCRYYACPEARTGPPEQRWCSTCPAAPSNRALRPRTPTGS